MHKLRYIAEGVLLGLILGLFRLLPMERASALGGWLGRRLGRHLKLSRIARRNLHRAFPDLEAQALETIVSRMWDNLGRILGEYPHLGRIYDSGQVEIAGAEQVARLSASGRGGIFFSAHYGNWELLSLCLDRLGLAPVLVYRPANNPLAERVIQRLRQRAHRLPVRYIPKSPQGLRPIIKALRAGQSVAMLVDQKLNEGIAVPFFGRDALTAPALAQLALKYRIPVIPGRIERLRGARFRVTALPPMQFERSTDFDADVAAAMGRIHALFEDWIRERPDHWLWVHNRWPDP